METKRILHIFSVLENIPRTGWLQRGVPRFEAETIAGHTFKVTAILSLITLRLSSKEDKVDGKKMILMGMIHDLAEAISGDMPKNLSKVLGQEEKERIEFELLRDIGERWDGLLELFSEYISRKTIEAKIVKLADLLATLRQAEEYRKRGFEVSDILDSCESEVGKLIDEIHDAEISDLLREVLFNPSR
ncbi:MAG: HD family hydrolase [Candidatus Verstraetearchaeota archaeon]|nr:HD family hydrolase [Candidatus Verstraetearchaeota archaeon]